MVQSLLLLCITDMTCMHGLTYVLQEQYGPADSGMLAPPTNPRVSYPPTTEMDQEVPSVPPAQSAPVPAFVKCYSLVDKPISPPPQSPPNVIIED